MFSVSSCGYPAQSSVSSQCLGALFLPPRTAPPPTPTIAREFFTKAMIITLCPVPPKGLTAYSGKSKFPTLGPEAFHSITHTLPRHWLHSYLTLSTPEILPGAEWTHFFCCLSFVHWGSISLSAHLWKSYPFLKVKPNFCPLIRRQFIWTDLTPLRARGLHILSVLPYALDHIEPSGNHPRKHSPCCPVCSCCVLNVPLNCPHQHADWNLQCWRRYISSRRSL